MASWPIRPSGPRWLGRPGCRHRVAEHGAFGGRECERAVPALDEVGVGLHQVGAQGRSGLDVPHVLHQVVIQEGIHCLVIVVGNQRCSRAVADTMRDALSAERLPTAAKPGEHE